MKNERNNCINSVNLNADSDFPYLVLDVVGDQSYPRNPGFQVMHWHEDLQFIYVLDGEIEIKTLDTSVQVNKGSLFGRFGRGAQALAEAMLTHGLVGCIASDAHRPDVRTPELLSAWDNLAEHFSERLSEQLLTRNPELILRSEPLPAGRFRPFF